MPDPTDRRRQLRLEMRERRAALDGDDQAAASMAVLARLARARILLDANLVAGYRAVRGEVDIDAAMVLLIEGGSTVTVPRVVGDHLEFAPWTPRAETAAGPFGIPEPTLEQTVPFSTHDVALVPLVAFDAAGNRLGQGGGYYDRALAGRRCGRPLAIGVAHSFQQVESIPAEPWDVALDAVVTEDTLHDFGSGTAADPI